MRQNSPVAARVGIRRRTSGIAVALLLAVAGLAIPAGAESPSPLAERCRDFAEADELCAALDGSAQQMIEMCLEYGAPSGFCDLFRQTEDTMTAAREGCRAFGGWADLCALAGDGEGEGATYAGCGEHPWCDPGLEPDARAGMVLAQMTLDEKLQLMGGDDYDRQLIRYRNYAPSINHGIPRLGIPKMSFSDGPVGFRHWSMFDTTDVTALPAGIALAAGWSPELARAYGAVIGTEVASYGGDVVLGPTVNIMRNPGGGRTFEGYGEDPHLTSRTAVGWIQGAQGAGVIADIKHYAANNQETDRFVTNAVIAERTLREIYLPAFEAAVTDAGVGSVMLAYNRVNGQKVTENTHLVREILKGDWGFEGIALTDYGAAQWSTAAAANAGTDLELPLAAFFRPEALRAAITSGQVSEAVINEALRRYLRTMFAFGVFDRPERAYDTGFDVAGHRAVARRAAEEAIVLMKNDQSLLPLDAAGLTKIVVIGAQADSYKSGGGSSEVKPANPVTPFAGIRDRAGPNVEVVFDRGTAPEVAARAAVGADVAIVVATDTETEFVDKPCLSLECPPADGLQDDLIAAVADANPNTIVVLETGGPVLMPWIAKVPAVLEAWYPGQEGGSAIASVLFGDVNPSGRLPVTFPMREGDRAASSLSQYPGIALNAEYSEGVFVGYRWFDEQGVEPLFPFGHGLSYSQFGYSNLEITADPQTPGQATVVLDVTNEGARAGSEVVQLYVGMPETVPQPPRQLKAFRKIHLTPDETQQARFDLDARAFSYWNEANGDWTVAPGCYRIGIGTSSRNIRLEQDIHWGTGPCAQTDPGGTVALP
ncbi:MAG: glycoside hydrolase family 3 C-terminal domain-containing protein [Actinomycetota bacterium]